MSLLLVPQEGLEPTRANAHYALNVARLPVPPLRRDVNQYDAGEYHFAATLSNPVNLN